MYELPSGKHAHGVRGLTGTDLFETPGWLAGWLADISVEPHHPTACFGCVRMLSFDYATGKTAAVSTTTVGGVARAYAFVPRAR